MSAPFDDMAAMAALGAAASVVAREGLRYSGRATPGELTEALRELRETGGTLELRVRLSPLLTATLVALDAEGMATAELFRTEAVPIQPFEIQ